MKAFADLYTTLDETAKTTAKVRALRAYFSAASHADAAWAVALLVGRAPRQAVPSGKLRVWAAQEAGIPDWLFQEAHDAVGDVSETIALLLPDPERAGDPSLSRWIEERLLPLRGQDEDRQRALLIAAWRELDTGQRVIWNKLVGGGFRFGGSEPLVTRALARLAGVDSTVIAHRLMGDWSPTPEFFARLIARRPDDADASRPYPFFLALSLDQPAAGLGDRGLWRVEWKWDGPRCQLIRRRGLTSIWSRANELVTARYPELAALGDLLPDGTALDGAIVPYKDGRILPISHLERRNGRKTLSRAVLAETPVVLIAHDLLEHHGVDIRDHPLDKRGAALASLAAREPRLRLSPILEASTWDELAAVWSRSRDAQAVGLMLKRRDSAYGVGRERGSWWKWKVEPFTINAVLTAARRGGGKRANLYSDYTFAVWKNGSLVTVAQACSGLTDAEIHGFDAFVRKNVIEKFGPMRTVKPELVFELAFDGIDRSNRHKSGLTARFPRIVRLRADMTAQEADHLTTLEALLPRPSDPEQPTGG